MWLNAALFLQFALPAGVALWLLWRFLVVPLVRRTSQKIAEEEMAEAIKREFDRRASENERKTAADEPLSPEEISSAVEEYLEGDADRESQSNENRDHP